MRRSIPIGVFMAVALLIPAVPAAAQTESSSQTGSSSSAQSTCQPVVYADFRELVTIDLDTASDVQVRVLADQLMAEATAERLATLPGELQERLDGTAADLRAFLKTSLLPRWSVNLRVAVNQTFAGAGTNQQTAAQQALDDGTVDAYLAYLNDGEYIARTVDAGYLRTYADFRELVTIDLDTASDVQVRVLADQLMAEATAERLATLPGELQERLDGTAADLRAFLKTSLLPRWSVNLRVAVNQTFAGAGTNQQTAAQQALDDGTVDAYLAYLNDGQYVTRAFDCNI